MEYTLYKLEFSTGLHIGRSLGGPSLDDGQMTIHSDTLFSALCCESLKGSKLADLYKAFAEGMLVISDALPCSADEIFLPKPVLYTGVRRQDGDPSFKKSLKSLGYIPLSTFDSYIGGLRGEDFDPADMKHDFGGMAVDTRVAIAGNSKPSPYNVAYWRFADDCGLYVVVGYEDEATLEILENILSNLGLSGIGGKQSVGLGKFSVTKIPVPDKLLELLLDEQAEYQMLLGVALPKDEELDCVLDSAWYSVIRRGGYVRSTTYSQTPLKKRTVFALSPGSCVKRRFRGVMLDLSDNGAHPVWRNCHTLFMGVRV